MAALPRIITVDPTWSVSRLVHAAIELTDRPVIQVDVPGGAEALDEMSRGGYNLLITALHIDKTMKGFELALRARQSAPNTAVIILADVDDQDIDEETRAESPFLYLRRPIDSVQFMRVIVAALDNEDIFAASEAPAQAAGSGASDSYDLGPVPPLDLKAAYTIIDKLLTDVGAMAIILSSRVGDVLQERGAVGYLNREQLTAALMPMVRTTVSMGDLVGGQTSALHFYDGETYDVFVLTVGFHHLLSLVFDGQAGARQFGAVTRFGRRAAEDLKALLGASAYLIQAPAPVEQTTRRSPARIDVQPEPEPVAPLAKADTWGAEEPEPPKEDALQLDPILNFDPSIFDALGALDGNAADDLFDPERLAEIANESRRGRGPLSYDEARELGIVP